MSCYLNAIDGDAYTLGYVTIKPKELLKKCSEWSDEDAEEIFEEFGVNSNDEETDESNNEESNSKEPKKNNISNDEFYAFYMIFGRDVLIEYGISEEKIQAWEDENL